MLHGMLNFCLNIPVLLVPKFFKFFENLLKDATNINVFLYKKFILLNFLYLSRLYLLLT